MEISVGLKAEVVAVPNQNRRLKTFCFLASENSLKPHLTGIFEKVLRRASKLLKFYCRAKRSVTKADFRTRFVDLQKAK